MVEVRRVIKSLVQHEDKLRAAQDILPNRFTTSDLEAALRKNRQQEKDAKSETQSMVQKLNCSTQAIERDASILQAMVRAAIVKRSTVSTMKTVADQHLHCRQWLHQPWRAKQCDVHWMGNIEKWIYNSRTCCTNDSTASTRLQLEKQQGLIDSVP